MEDIAISLFLGGHPERYSVPTSSYKACVPEPTYLASSYQTIPPRCFILVEVLKLFTKHFSDDLSMASILTKYLASYLEGFEGLLHTTRI
jgi:hypothetical protein